MLFQAGGNDLHTLTLSENPISSIALAQEIIGAGKMCSKHSGKVIISSILPRADFHLNIKRWEVNVFLQGLCVKNNFTFLDHSNINVREHLLKDGVHLNEAGTKLFASNMVNCLNKLSG